MNRPIRWIVATAIVALAFGGTPLVAQQPAVRELLAKVGLQGEDNTRGQMDVVGFASTAQQMDSVLALCREEAQERQDSLKEMYGWNDTTLFRAGVCPHDDYAYAGRLYPLLLSRIKAKRVILFGVFHKAKVFGSHDVLVFDSFDSWHGPYGRVKVATSLRDAILRQMPAEEVVVDNDAQQVEHSVEAIVPWLQAMNPDVEIMSILVPYMGWERLATLSDHLSDALTDILRERGWELGKDVAIISSSDAVHYGDAGWGGADYAPFGADVAGYEKAVQRDLDLAKNQLAGPVEDGRLKGFFDRCVDPDDVYQYRITWCGRFSIPLGIRVAGQVAQQIGEAPLDGVFLDYGTSVSEATLPLDKLSGMGTTAPNNLHHWVGYAAVGYR